jgi:hypothetical protein
MSQQELRRAHGNWVSGDRFWDREEELALLAEYLEEGAHLLITAPRRIGKTSLMREAMNRLEGRFTCLFVDLEKSSTAADAIVELSAATRAHASLWAKTRDVFRNILSSVTGNVESLQVAELTVKLRGGLTADDWQAKGDQLFDALAAAEGDVVIFLDEVPILVNRILYGDDYRLTPERRREADAFLSWLHEGCQRHRGQLRIVVTGSIGLEPILRRAGLSATLNVLTRFEVKPWSREIAAGCLEALGRRHRLVFEEGAIERLLDRLGVCIPHHVQMFFVEEVYKHEMLNVRGHAELSHLEERLKDVLGPDRYPLALDLLTEAAVSGELSAQPVVKIAAEHLADHERPLDEAREILSVLEHDGYLCREGEVYTFDSNLLRDWWQARFGFAFTPASQRQD